MPLWLEILVQCALSFFGTIGFGLTINIPKRALVYSGISGMVGWIVFWLLMQVNMGRGISNVLGAFFIGLTGIYFSRKLKMPVIIFNIPGIVPIVPGVPAYQTIRALSQGNLPLATQMGVKTMIIIGGIAMGVMLSQLASELTSRYVHYKRDQKAQS